MAVLRTLTRPSTLLIAVLVILTLGLPATNVPVVAQDDPCTTVTEIPSSECEALEALYNSTNGPGWTNSTGWLEDNTPCDWFGVTCGDGSVVGLDLFNNGLSGTIPPELGNFANLTSLWLWGNQLSGTIPPQLGNLTNLTRLRLSDNQLTGTIPPELGNLANLTSLSLSGNQLSGTIPPELGNLANLTELFLAVNQLSGTIPTELGNLTNLTRLWLDFNELTGTIPPELGNLANLSLLLLSDNQLLGTIPPELGSLANLTSLRLESNQLNGSIPPELGNLANLSRLDLFNNQLSGAIPPELGNLANLTSLSLWGNQLSGTIPSELGNLTNLEGLLLDRNQLSGIIPPELGNLSNLFTLGLSRNALVGEIPSTFNATNLPNLSDSPGSEFDHNGLYATDPATIDLLNTLDPDWADTQTVAPTNFTFSAIDSNTLELNWTPISYQADPGGYWVGCAYMSGGAGGADAQYVDGKATATLVRNLPAADTLSCSITTETAPHANNANTVTSEPVTLEITLPDVPFCETVSEIPFSECVALADIYRSTGGAEWMENNGWTILDEPTDLAIITIDGPTEITVDDSPTYSFTIRNEGLTPTGENSYTLSFSAEPEIQRGGVIENLNPGESTIIQRDVRADLSGDHTLTLTVTTEFPDGNLVNNTAVLNIMVLPPTVTPDGPTPTQTFTPTVTLTPSLTGTITPTFTSTIAPTFTPTPSGGGGEDGGTFDVREPLAAPCEWFGVTCADGHVVALELPSNNLTGTLPSSIGNLNRLTVLNLQSDYNDFDPGSTDNFITGSIPSEIGNLISLEELILSGNQLSGDIPPELANLSNLRVLNLVFNQLSGNIPPELGNLSNLVALYLLNNQLTGAIPPELGNLTNLSELLLSGNGLNGSIPPELGNLSNLSRLYLYNTQVSGPIPPELGNLTNLTGLIAGNAQLSGAIPPELGNLTNLTALSLSNNQLSGVIPPELGNLTNLEALDVSGNALVGEIPPTINQANLPNLGVSGQIGGLTIPTSIDYNGLSTSDPDTLALMEIVDPDWSLTQTVAPDGLTVEIVSIDPEKRFVEVTFGWQAVPYVANISRRVATTYEITCTPVRFSDDPDQPQPPLEPIVVAGSRLDWTARLPQSPDDPYNTFNCEIIAITPQHDNNARNQIISLVGTFEFPIVASSLIDLEIAINRANEDGDPTVIVLDPEGDYSDVARISDRVLPPIETPIILEGNGATIALPEGVGDFQFFQVAPSEDGSSSLTLRNITLGGAPGLDGGRGGAILNQGTLTLDGVRFVANGSDRDEVGGSAVFNDAGAVLTINSGIFEGNGQRVIFNADGEVYIDGALFTPQILDENARERMPSQPGTEMIFAQGGVVYVQNASIDIASADLNEAVGLITANAGALVDVRYTTVNAVSAAIFGAGGGDIMVSASILNGECLLPTGAIINITSGGYNRYNTGSTCANVLNEATDTDIPLSFDTLQDNGGGGALGTLVESFVPVNTNDAELFDVIPASDCPTLVRPGGMEVPARDVRGVPRPQFAFTVPGADDTANIERMPVLACDPGAVEIVGNDSLQTPLYLQASDFDIPGMGQSLLASLTVAPPTEIRMNIEAGRRPGLPPIDDNPCSTGEIGQDRRSRNWIFASGRPGYPTDMVGTDMLMTVRVDLVDANGMPLLPRIEIYQEDVSVPGGQISDGTPTACTDLKVAEKGTIGVVAIGSQLELKYRIPQALYNNPTIQHRVVVTFDNTDHPITQDISEKYVTIDVEPWRQCFGRDCNILLQLYAQAKGTFWINKLGWAVDDPEPSQLPETEPDSTAYCTWYGVTCDDLGNVTGLNLSRNNLTGALPPSFGTLADLTTLDLSSNALRGPFPVLPAFTTPPSGALRDPLDIVLDYNAFDIYTTDPVVTQLLPGWGNTQVTPPNVQFDLEKWALVWPPIPYQAVGGYYEVRCNTAEWTVVPFSDMPIFDLPSDFTASACAVRSYAPANVNLATDLTSDPRLIEITNPSVDQVCLVSAGAQSAEDRAECAPVEVINRLEIPAFSVEARVDDVSEVGSVIFDLQPVEGGVSRDDYCTGVTDYTRIENAPPYLIAGNDDFNFRPWTVADGAYTLTVVACHQPAAQGGTLRDPVTMDVLIENQAVNDVAAVDINGNPMDVTMDGEVMVITYNEDLLFTFIADLYDNPNVESVVFSVTKRDNDTIPTAHCDQSAECRRVENVRPYTLAGNVGEDDLFPWHAEPGQYTLTIQPYTADNAQGEAIGDPFTQDFDLILQEAAPTPTPTITPTVGPDRRATQALLPTLPPIERESANLLTNGDFELAAERDPSLPMAWDMATGDGASRRCERASLLDTGGLCELRVPAGDSRTVVRQTVDGSTVAPGDSLQLRASVDAGNLQANATISVRVTYTDGTRTTYALDGITPGSNGYQLLSTDFTLDDKSVESMVVRVRVQPGDGRLFVDNLALDVTSTSRIEDLPPRRPTPDLSR